VRFERVPSESARIERLIEVQFLTMVNIDHHFLVVDHEAELINQLRNRDQQVIHLIGWGVEDQQIASHIWINVSTVRHHLVSIYSKPWVSV